MPSILVAFFLFVSLIASSVSAQVKIATFKDWTVYSTPIEGVKTCYIASFPVDKTGNYTKRDEPYILVTRVCQDTYEVSTSSGYKYKKNSDVKANIDGKVFTLLTEGELAWLETSQQDKSMISSMKAGSTLKIRGTSIKGTYSIDTYSLSGVTAAHKHMQKNCD